jgi:hypothetical protein
MRIQRHGRVLVADGCPAAAPSNSGATQQTWRGCSGPARRDGTAPAARLRDAGAELVEACGRTKSAGTRSGAGALGPGGQGAAISNMVGWGPIPAGVRPRRRKARMSVDGQVIEFVDIVQRLTTPWACLLFRQRVREAPSVAALSTYSQLPALHRARTRWCHHAPRSRSRSRSRTRRRQAQPCPLLAHSHGLTFP